MRRVRLVPPLKGTVGTARVFAVDISLGGVRLAHQDPIGKVGERCSVTVEWEGRRMILRGVIRHQRVERPAPNPSAKTLYHSGVEIEEATESSRSTLRDLIQVQIERALDEQRANARGIPAVAANSFQTGKGDRFVRHELNAGVWKATPTLESKQPPTGFTVSAELEPDEVRMLREAYEQGDAAARAMIKQMSALSISKSEGIPTRRYEP